MSHNDMASSTLALESLAGLASLSVLIYDTMDALLAKTGIVVNVLRRKLTILLENQFYR